MQKMARIVLLMAIVALASPSAFAKAKVSVFGAADYYKVMDFGSYDDGSGNTVSTKGDLGYGGGMLFEFPLGRVVGFELGGIFLRKKMTSTTTASADLTSSTHMKGVSVPGEFRFHFGRVFSVHAGGYYEKSLEDGGGTNYGATAGLRMDIPTKFGSFFLEPRYNHGLKDRDGALKDKTVLGLVGMTFGNSK